MESQKSGLPDENLVIGIDPGTALMGWGLVRLNTGDDSYEPVKYGAFSTPSSTPMPLRLKSLFQQLTGILEEYRPGQFVIEELFFSKNTTTALAVGQARGIALLAAANQNLEVFEYTPLQVKQALVSYGRATKFQVQEMVRMLLKLDQVPQPDDAADALAIAICHLRNRKFQALLDASLNNNGKN